MDLGTDRTVRLPWLTSLDDPDGRAVAIGAEGLLPRRTSIVLSGFDVQALVSDDDVRELMTERVGEAPDAPLVWQKAVAALIDGLTGSGARGRPGSR